MKYCIRFRPTAPLEETPESINQRVAWYPNLRNERDQIRDRWNDKDSEGNQPVRDMLLALTEKECVYCGTFIGGGKSWEVEHYLPKEKFPRLSYCWTNLLPGCAACNKYRKRGWYPKELNENSLVDPILEANPPEVQHYQPSTILPHITDRIVDSTSENPSEHLTFVPAVHGYSRLTDVGGRTIRVFFNEKDDAQRFEKISTHVKILVQNSPTRFALQQALDSLISLIGASFYVKTYADYWLQFFPLE